MLWKNKISLFYSGQFDFIRVVKLEVKTLEVKGLVSCWCIKWISLMLRNRRFPETCRAKKAEIIVGLESRIEANLTLHNR